MAQCFNRFVRRWSRLPLSRRDVPATAAHAERNSSHLAARADSGRMSSVRSEDRQAQRRLDPAPQHAQAPALCRQAASLGLALSARPRQHRREGALSSTSWARRDGNLVNRTLSSPFRGKLASQAMTMPAPIAGKRQRDWAPMFWRAPKPPGSLVCRVKFAHHFPYAPTTQPATWP